MTVSSFHVCYSGTGHMKQLAMSHNALGSQGLDLLLRSLPCDTLTHLEIGSVGVRSEEQQPLCDAVVSYLAQVRLAGWLRERL